MAYMDYNKLFSCPRCGNSGAIFLVKVAGTLVIIKQKCPTHGARSFKVPLLQEELYIDTIRDGVFRCFKCGQETTVDQVKAKGPWTLVKCNCPTHGNKLPFQKISSIIYNRISGPEVATAETIQPAETAQPAEPAQPRTTPSEVASFCPNCGEAIEGKEKYCGTCGAELD
ncbi:MAG: zinc-ribbon domain-containing protein [Promethearchaeota archaeon]